MKTNRNYILVGGGILIVLILAWILASQPKQFNWQENYRVDREEPYDLSLFFEVLESSATENFTVISSLSADESTLEKTGSSLIYVDNFALLDSNSVVQFVKFLEAGNTVFLSTNGQNRFYEEIFQDCSNTLKIVKTLEAERIIPYTGNFDSDTSNSIGYQWIDQIETYPWAYFSIEPCVREKFEPLGQFREDGNDYSNFGRIPVGKGILYVHSTPLLFSNFYFSKIAVFNHVQDLLADLPKGEIIYFDPKSDKFDQTNRPPIAESPLSFILSHQPLRWAWYLILTLALLYLLNAVRRAQKPIPIKPIPVNETAQYLEVVSRMYQKNGRHKHLVELQEKMIFSHLRNKYKLIRTKNEESFYAEAARVLQADEKEIRNFFKGLNRAKNNSTLSDKEFKDIDRQITEFYEKCP